MKNSLIMEKEGISELSFASSLKSAETKRSQAIIDSTIKRINTLVLKMKKGNNYASVASNMISEIGSAASSMNDESSQKVLNILCQYLNKLEMKMRKGKEASELENSLVQQSIKDDTALAISKIIEAAPVEQNKGHKRVLTGLYTFLKNLENNSNKGSQKGSNLITDKKKVTGSQKFAYDQVKSKSLLILDSEKREKLETLVQKSHKTSEEDLNDQEKKSFDIEQEDSILNQKFKIEQMEELNNKFYEEKNKTSQKSKKIFNSVGLSDRNKINDEIIESEPEEAPLNSIRSERSYRSLNKENMESEPRSKMTIESFTKKSQSIMKSQSFKEQWSEVKDQVIEELANQIMKKRESILSLGLKEEIFASEWERIKMEALEELNDPAVVNQLKQKIDRKKTEKEPTKEYLPSQSSLVQTEKEENSKKSEKKIMDKQDLQIDQNNKSKEESISIKSGLKKSSNHYSISENLEKDPSISNYLANNPHNEVDMASKVEVRSGLRTSKTQTEIFVEYWEKVKEDVMIELLTDIVNLSQNPNSQNGPKTSLNSNNNKLEVFSVYWKRAKELILQEIINNKHYNSAPHPDLLKLNKETFEKIWEEEKSKLDEEDPYVTRKSLTERKSLDKDPEMRSHDSRRASFKSNITIKEVVQANWDSMRDAVITELIERENFVKRPKTVGSLDQILNEKIQEEENEGGESSRKLKNSKTDIEEKNNLEQKEKVSKDSQKESSLNAPESPLDNSELDVKDENADIISVEKNLKNDSIKNLNENEHPNKVNQDNLNNTKDNQVENQKEENFSTKSYSTLKEVVEEKWESIKESVFKTYIEEAEKLEKNKKNILNDSENTKSIRRVSIKDLRRISGITLKEVTEEQWEQIKELVVEKVAEIESDQQKIESQPGTDRSSLTNRSLKIQDKKILDLSLLKAVESEWESIQTDFFNKVSARSNIKKDSQRTTKNDQEIAENSSRSGSLIEQEATDKDYKKPDSNLKNEQGSFVPKERENKSFTTLKEATNEEWDRIKNFAIEKLIESRRSLIKIETDNKQEIDEATKEQKEQTCQINELIQSKITSMKEIEDQNNKPDPNLSTNAQKINFSEEMSQEAIKDLIDEHWLSLKEAIIENFENKEIPKIISEKLESLKEISENDNKKISEKKLSLVSFESNITLKEVVNSEWLRVKNLALTAFLELESQISQINPEEEKEAQDGLEEGKDNQKQTEKEIPLHIPPNVVANNKIPDNNKKILESFLKKSNSSVSGDFISSEILIGSEDSKKDDPEFYNPEDVRSEIFKEALTDLKEANQKKFNSSKSGQEKNTNSINTLEEAFYLNWSELKNEILEELETYTMLKTSEKLSNDKKSQNSSQYSIKGNLILNLEKSLESLEKEAEPSIENRKLFSNKDNDSQSEKSDPKIFEFISKKSKSKESSNDDEENKKSLRKIFEATPSFKENREDELVKVESDITLNLLEKKELESREEKASEQASIGKKIILNR